MNAKRRKVVLLFGGVVFVEQLPAKELLAVGVLVPELDANFKAFTNIHRLAGGSLENQTLTCFSELQPWQHLCQLSLLALHQNLGPIRNCIAFSVPEKLLLLDLEINSF